jgi:hypothetical protein
MSVREGQPVDCGSGIADCGLENAPTAQRSSGQGADPKSRISNLQCLLLLQRIHAADRPERADIEAVLRTDDPHDLDLLFDFADCAGLSSSPTSAAIRADTADSTGTTITCSATG